MDTKNFGIDEILKIKQAIGTLLKVPGIVRKKVYLLDRLRQHLKAPINQYQEEAGKIHAKYAEAIPSTAFIPPSRYQAFIAELNEEIAKFEKDPAVIPMIPSTLISNLLFKYEVTASIGNQGKMAIPPESQKIYEEEMDKLSETFKRDIEFFPIEMDENIENALQYLPGELQLALDFVFVEEKKGSGLIVPYPTKLVQ